MEQHRLPLNKTSQSNMPQPNFLQDMTHLTTDNQQQYVITTAVQFCTQSRSHTPCTTNVDIICRQFILNVFLNKLRYMKFSPTTKHLIQISIYLVQVSYMFQSHMVMRLAYKKEKKFTVAFRTDISELYMSISIQYIYVHKVEERSE